MFGMCMCAFKKVMKKMIFYWRREREKKKKREGQSGGPLGEKKSLVLSIDPTIFNLFIKRSLSNVTWKLKTCLVYDSKQQVLVFKHWKIIVLKKTTHLIRVFFRNAWVMLLILECLNILFGKLFLPVFRFQIMLLNDTFVNILKNMEPTWLDNT